MIIATLILATSLLMSQSVCLYAQDKAALPERQQTTPKEKETILIIPRTGEQVPVPTTDAEGLRLLDSHDTQLTTIMRNLYRLYRAQGLTVLDAYVKVLETLRDVHEAQDR